MLQLIVYTMPARVFLAEIPEVWYGTQNILVEPVSTGMYPDQAIRWAARFDGNGYVNEYEYTPNESLRIKSFPEMSEEWLDFNEK